MAESYKPDSDMAKSASGNYIAIKLKFEGKEGKFSVNPLYVHLKKSDGKIIGSDEGDGEYAVPSDQSFPAGSEAELSAGKVLIGVVAFDTVYDAGAAILITSLLGHITGQWPLSGGEPRAGDGNPTREINKSLTHKQFDGSAAVTLVSVSESKGGLDDLGAPESGTFVIVDMTFEGKTGAYSVNSLYLKIKTPDDKIIEDNDGNATYGVALEQQLDSGDLEPGKTMKGKIAFDTALQPGTKLVITDHSDKINGEWPL